jgi:hypothetical protein
MNKSVAIVELKHNGMASNEILEIFVKTLTKDPSIDNDIVESIKHRYYVPKLALNINQAEVNQLDYDTISKHREGSSYPSSFEMDKEMLDLLDNVNHILIIKEEESKFLPTKTHIFKIDSFLHSVAGAQTDKGKTKTPELKDILTFLNIKYDVNELSNLEYSVELLKEIFLMMVEQKIVNFFNCATPSFKTSTKKNEAEKAIFHIRDKNMIAEAEVTVTNKYFFEFKGFEFFLSKKIVNPTQLKYKKVVPTKLKFDKPYKKSDFSLPYGQIDSIKIWTESTSVEVGTTFTVEMFMTGNIELSELEFEWDIPNNFSIVDFRNDVIDLVCNKSSKEIISCSITYKNKTIQSQDIKVTGKHSVLELLDTGSSKLMNLYEGATGNFVSHLDDEVIFGINHKAIKADNKVSGYIDYVKNNLVINDAFIEKVNKFKKENCLEGNVKIQKSLF